MCNYKLSTHRLSTGETESGPWTQVLDKELEDSQQQQDDDPSRLQMIALDKETEAQFVKFDLISWWGRGGGLQYFDILRNKGKQFKRRLGVS